MKKKIFTLIAILMIAVPTASFSEKTIDQKIADLEKKLPTVSGKEKIEVLNELAYEYLDQSAETCIKYANQALKLSRKLNHRKGEATALKYISDCYRIMGNHEKALECAQRSFKIFEKSGDKKGSSNSLMAIGRVYDDLSNYQKALECYLKSLKIREEIGDKKSISPCLNSIGIVYGRKGNYDKALEYFQKSLKIYEDIGDKKSTATFLCNIGIVYGRKGNYDKALEYQLKSLQLREEIGDKSGISDSLHNIGNIYNTLSNYDKGLEYHLESLKIREEIGDKSRISGSLHNIGTVYISLGNYDKALDYLLESLKINKEIGDKNSTAISLGCIGIVYEELIGYDKALEYYLESLKIYEEVGSKYGILGSLNNIGEVYTKLQKYDKALENFEQSLKIAKEIKAKSEVKNLYKNFSQLYAAKGDYKKALEYHKLYFEINDKIFNEKSSKQIAEMQTRFETLEKEKKIELLEKNSEIQKLRLSRETITKYAFISGFILVLIIAVLLFRKYLYLFSFWKKQKYISQFRLMEELGTGGMGIVYKAHSIRDKTDTAAIKVLKPELFKDETSRKRFRQEAAIIDKLEHPNIVEIIERGEYKEKLFIAMELLQGKTLDVKIDENGKMDLDECFHIMIQISDALVLIHSKEIIHRDLKPSNIMLVERDGDPNFVKLLDFGLARMKFQTRITRTGVLMGTLNYMSPEQLAHSEFSLASDVYSLGVTFYEMVTGKIAFPGETANEIMKQVLDTTPIEPRRFRPDIPGELNDLIMKMLEKDKESRPVINDVLLILSKMR